MSERHCRWCGKKLEKRPQESRPSFAARKLCSRACYREETAERWKGTGPDYIVDDGECWVWQRSLDTHGYAQARINGRTQLVHRVNYARAYGEVPPQLDHRCRNRRCVNPAHLRPATNYENSQNLALAGRGRSGYRGVHWSAATNKWAVVVKANGRRHYLGVFADVEQAARVASAFRARNLPFSEADRAAA